MAYDAVDLFKWTEYVWFHYLVPFDCVYMCVFVYYVFAL